MNNIQNTVTAARDLKRNGIDAVVIVEFDGVGDSYASGSKTSDSLYHWRDGSDESIQNKIDAGRTVTKCSIEII